MTLPLQNAWLWALVACGLAVVFEGIMSGTGVKARLAELRFPRGAPRLWAWSVIGGGYYVLFFFVLKSLLDRPPIRDWTSVGLSLAVGLLVANASWNWIFFRKKNLRLSYFFFVPYLLVALMLAAVFQRIRSQVLGWYSLYLAYLVYATWWARGVWHLNRDSSQTVN